MSPSRSLAGALLLFLAATNAFTTSPTARRTAQLPPTVLRMTKKDEERKMNPFGQMLGIFGVAAAVLTINAADVPAANIPASISQENVVFYSPSIQLAATVKTMDFSLPSSYDKISDATAKATDELTVQQNLVTGVKTKAKSSSSDAGGMSFGKTLTEEEKAAISADREARKEALAAEKAAIAAEKAAEKEAIAAQKKVEQEEKLAQQAADREAKAAEKAAKAAAAKKAATKEAEEREAKMAAGKFSSADIVDMGLPSYSDSASSGGKKASMFAL